MEDLIREARNTLYRMRITVPVIQTTININDYFREPIRFHIPTNTFTGWDLAAEDMQTTSFGVNLETE